MKFDCNRTWEADAIDDGRLSPADVASFERHCRTCLACRDRAGVNERVRGLARAQPDEAPAELQLRRLRARILRDAARASWPRRRWLGPIAFAATLAVVVLLLMRFVHGRRASVHDSTLFAGVVTPMPGAHWSQGRKEKVERVSLLDGEIHVLVRKQAPDERFLVEVPDGELEVRGTTFQVATRAGATVRVHVDDGLVLVRIGSGAEVALSAGESWPPAVTAIEPPPDTVPPGPDEPAVEPPSPPSRSRPVARSSRAASPPVTDDWSSDYEAAMALYHDGRFVAAAEAFHRFASEHPASGLIDDATFLEAVSLASAGRHDAAGLAAERHIARFPGSFHRKDAAILVARAARARGDCEGARQALAPWLGARGGAPDSVAAQALGICATH